MLQALREKMTGWVALVVIGLMIIPFAFFGVGDYFSARSENWVAKVGDSEISPDDLRRRVEEFRSQMRNMMGDAFDARYFEQPEVRRQMLDRLIEEEVLMQASKEMGLEVPAERLREEIASIPAFQVGGAFDREQYTYLLSMQGMSPALFQQRMLREIVVQEIPRAIAASALVTEADVDRYLALREQTRDFRYVRVAAPTVVEDTLDEEDLQSWYAANLDRFMQPEQVTIEYVEIRESDVEVDTSIDESELRRRYQEQRVRFVEEEQRLVSHILVQVAPAADAATQKQALERAQALAERAREEGADFAEIARESSEDIGSRGVGGELGWLERGMTHAPFEDAAFAAERGVVSDPVLSPDGYHIILVQDISEERGKSFEEVRFELEREILEGERERRFAEISGELMDLVFRDPTSLAPVSDALRLQIRTEGPFTRMGGQGVAAHPEVVRTAFSDSVLLDGLTSDPIETGIGHALVLRVKEHVPAAPRPFEEVREQVAAGMRAEARASAARERVDAMMARLRSGEASLEALAEEIEVDVGHAEGVGRNAVNHDSRLVAEVFRLPHPGDSPHQALVPLAGDAYALVELTGVTAGDPAAVDAAIRRQARETLASGASSGETRAFVEALKARSRIRVADDRL
ncbi:MAG TPA: SurA N-terminal domain-containing protein [Xanthomonadaceae bacterium]|nr:SurA N-terminal domain-containing protein [Xanthomonadaceae bacterium]